MPRFLTPAKVGLLVLIELYTQGAVSISSTITVLSFITSHLLPSSLPQPQNRLLGDISGDQKEAQLILTIQSFRTALSDQPSARIPGRSLWDLFLEKFWNIDSLNALHEFFELRSVLLVKTKEEIQANAAAGSVPPDESAVVLSRTSPFGTFVRRSQLEFARLKFHDVTELWKSFVAYRQPTLSMWQKRHPNMGHWGFDAVLREGDLQWGPEVAETLASLAYGTAIIGEYNVTNGFVSTDDVEKLLEFQIEQMQKMGSRVPDTVQDQFETVLSNNVMIPSLSHYVNFLDAWKAGDYPTSFDNLHRFFDYTMQNRDRLFYQYALLNLAVLQADFGCYQEAVAAMQETVSTARENKDMGCLNFSLSWLYHFGKAHPNVINEADKTNMLGVEREGLAFLRVKAKESGMWSLWSSSLLSEAKLGLCNGESVATAFENVLKSSQLTITNSMMNNIGAQMMLQSSIWSRLGNNHLAWSYCEVFLRCHSRHAPFDDVLKFTCRIAYILTQKGKYTEAMSRLEELDSNSLRSIKANQYWLRFRGILRLKRDLHRNNLDGAEQLLTQLLHNRGGDPDLAFEVHILHIDIMVRRHNYSSAFARIEELAAELKDRGDDVFFRIKLLLLKADLLDKCGRPQRGFSIAVRAANTAWRARLLPILWQSMGTIANILCSLHEFAAAAAILSSVIPRALECEDSALSAQLFGRLVDAYMGMAGKEDKGGLKRTEYLNKAVEAIERSFAEWSAIEDTEGMCEMMMKKSVVFRVLGERQSSNNYAAKVLAMRRDAKEERERG